MNDKPVLAMYDVRGKQDYIYRSSHIKEIIGASCIIRDVFQDYLYPAARTVRNKYAAGYVDEKAIYCYDKALEKPEHFSVEAFQRRMEGNQYIGEIVYDGGGNFLVLYKSRDICKEVNRIFTRDLIIHTYTLKVLCTYLEEVNFQDYRGDNRKLHEIHRINESQESVICPVNSLPIVQVDYETFRPFSVLRRKSLSEKSEKMTIENAAKYKKYWEEADQKGEEAGQKVLDRIVTEKGKESLLAVIYIDGNNMGAKVQTCLGEKESYADCVDELRRFSKKIQKEYVDDRISDINSMLDRKYKEKKRRTIVEAGDEITIICNAQDALDVVETYFEGMSEGNSSCAGIAIFHSHAPFADAYRIAEECCESGKQRMKEEGLSEANFVDFHYCQSGIGISLNTIRKMEGTARTTAEKGGSLSRPWRAEEAFESEKFYYTINMAREMGKLLKQAKRSNIKSLLEYAKDSPAKLQMELERINAHRDQPLDFSLGGRINKRQMQKLIYDVVLVYDLWFDKKEDSDGQDRSKAEN